jgi:hypothetical protein
MVLKYARKKRQRGLETLAKLRVKETILDEIADQKPKFEQEQEQDSEQKEIDIIDG